MTQQTSIEAFNSVKEQYAPTLREEVHSALKQISTGMTVEELEAYIGARENSIRPRLTELKELGFAGENGVRKNSRGRNQKVWVATAVAA